MTDPNFGCRWEYKGQPCEVKGVNLHDYGHGSEVIGLIVNAGIGPDIEAMLADLTYEKKQS